MSEEYLKQMRKLEMQNNNLVNQYDNDEERLDNHDFANLVNSKSICTPEKGETWAHYADRIAIYVKIAADKNRLTHIDGPRKAWYTHRSPMGCFMCESINIEAVMRRVIGIMAIQYPNNLF